MPGAGKSDSRALQVVGFVVAAIAVVGTVALDWDFGGLDDGVLPLAIALVAVVVAVSATIYTRVV
jgi:hypothetical protein